MVEVGYGSVDEKTIMKAGNIVNFPFKKSTSVKMNCDRTNAMLRSGDLSAANGESFTLSGDILLSDGNAVDQFNMTFTAVDANRVRFEATAPNANSSDNGTNYMSLKFDSDPTEEIYGMGL